MEASSDPVYEQIKERGWQALNAGRFDEALRLFETSLSHCRQRGDRLLATRARCNRAAVLVEMGQTGTVKQELLAILVEGADLVGRFLASYTLSRAYEIEGRFEKAIFYARIAKHHAGALDAADLLSSSHNRLGSLLLAQSDFDGAERELRRALELLPEPSVSLRRAGALDNLGYCHVVRHRFRQGFAALFESLQICRRLGAPRQEMHPRISLAFAYLQIGRHHRAERHATIGLELAERFAVRAQIKHALFVLGEACKLSGNPLAARRHFSRLQEDYYPDTPYASDLLLFLDVQNLINIKA